MKKVKIVRKKRHLVLGFLLTLVFGCGSKDTSVVVEEPIRVPQVTTGVVTLPFNETGYSQVLYVDVSNKSDNKDGTKDAPYTSIIKALENSNGQQSAILVARGNYNEETLQLKKGVDLHGGFDSADWSRNIENNETIISGENKRRVLIGANNSSIDGFIIAQGSIRGAGGGLYCDGTSPKVTNNVFIGNATLKPENWNPKFLHETANNGGAIYGVNGASPTITNNVFLNNRTENGRGAAISFDNKCKVVISNNVFLNNIAGLDDPMRSSDGGAISIFDWCDAEISNNIFLGNKALTKNDGGAIFVALWSSARITNNIIVNSESGDDAGALFVGGQEHRYDGPLDPIPSKDDFYVTIDNNQFYGNKNSSMNSGTMRFTMESLGEFTNNRLAFNSGTYFQRSEVAVRDNIILDNFLFVETKDGLKQGSIENNVIWGDFELTTPAIVSGNKIRDGYEEGTDNTNDKPRFEDDGKTFNIVAATFDPKKMISSILVSNGTYKENQLVNRVVRAGESWGIIRSNSKSDMTVWGNLFGIGNFQMLPTYTLKK